MQLNFNNFIKYYKHKTRKMIFKLVAKNGLKLHKANLKVLPF